MSLQIIKTGDSKVDRAVREVMDRLVKLEKKNSASEAIPKQSEGTPGSIRAARMPDGKIHLQVRNKDGWQDAGELNFQEKV